MIYIRNTTEAQAVSLPNTWGRTLDGDTFKLTLFSGAERRQVASIECHNTAPDWRTAITIGFTLTATLPAGEYVYELTQGDTPWSTGLARVGDFAAPITPHATEGITFQQYEG